MNALERRRIARAAGGAFHMLIDDGPDDRDDFDDDEIPCCIGSAMRGPRACSCWVPIYDLEQASPDQTLAPVTRDRCCHDCAYRNDSPERVAGETEELISIATDGSRFACHQGMRRVVSWRHPDGREIPAGDGDYKPPIIDAVAFRADGTPADLCAGWSAHRLSR